MTREELAKLPANLIEKQDPERFKAITGLIREGVPFKVIQRTHGVSRHTIEKVIATDETLQLGTRALVNKLMKLGHHASDTLAERFEERPDEITTKDAAVTLGIASDKLERMLASQTPQHQVNVQINVGEAADLNALAQGLPSNPSQPIDVEEVKPSPKDQ